jgi:hypothetical protein
LGSRSRKQKVVKDEKSRIRIGDENQFHVA